MRDCSAARFPRGAFLLLAPLLLLSLLCSKPAEGNALSNVTTNGTNSNGTAAPLALCAMTTASYADWYAPTASANCSASIPVLATIRMCRALLNDCTTGSDAGQQCSTLARQCVKSFVSCVNNAVGDASFSPASCPALFDLRTALLGHAAGSRIAQQSLRDACLRFLCRSAAAFNRSCGASALAPEAVHCALASVAVSRTLTLAVPTRAPTPQPRSQPPPPPTPTSQNASSVPPVPTGVRVRLVRLVLNMTIEDFVPAFFVASLSTTLGIATTRIVLHGVQAGSVIVLFYFTASNGTTEVSADQLVEAFLVVAAGNNAFTQAFPVISVQASLVSLAGTPTPFDLGDGKTDSPVEVRTTSIPQGKAGISTTLVFIIMGAAVAGVVIFTLIMLCCCFRRPKGEDEGGGGRGSGCCSCCGGGGGSGDVAEGGGTPRANPLSVNPQSTPRVSVISDTEDEEVQQARAKRKGRQKVDDGSCCCGLL